MIARRLTTAAGAAVTLVALAGCGSSGSSSTHATNQQHKTLTAAEIVCRPSVIGLIAQHLGVAASQISTSTPKANNEMPQCSFATHTAKHRRIGLLVNYDTGPQPYFIVERTAEEAAQVFTPSRMVAPPVTINHLGLEAFWFPARDQVMATDGIRLITVTVNWPHSRNADRRTIAVAIARPYLKITKQGRAAAKGYP